MMPQKVIELPYEQGKIYEYRTRKDNGNEVQVWFKVFSLHPHRIQAITIELDQLYANSYSAIPNPSTRDIYTSSWTVDQFDCIYHITYRQHKWYYV